MLAAESLIERDTSFNPPTPGTGKSSLAIALASHFKLKVCVASISKIWSDESLKRLFIHVPARAVVFLEDNDVFGLNRKAKKKAETNPEKKKKHEGHNTLSGLLNILDGVTAQEGRIAILTTNCVEDLDLALPCPGRCDKRFYLGKMKTHAIKSMFLDLFSPLGVPSADLQKSATEFSELVPKETYTPAELQGYLLSHLDCAKLAILGFQQWAEEKEAEQEGNPKPMIKNKKQKDKEGEGSTNNASTTSTETQTKRTPSKSLEDKSR